MDLITVKQGVWVLHLVDTFTRYSAACIQRSKKPDTIVDGIIKMWIAYFGTPKKFIADNGGEFANQEYTDMCKM
jgi:transposase InsO family protein